jgi:hypothetical protein
MIICLVGYKGAGKSTVAARLMVHQFRLVKFADGLKGMLRQLGLTDRELEGDLKEAPCELLGGKTPRHAMQTLGTEWGRKLIGDDLWVRAWKLRVQDSPVDDIVCDDLRFPNEYAAAKSMGAKVVFVGRPGCKSDGHESESFVSKMPYDSIILNHGTVEDLSAAVDNVILGHIPVRGFGGPERGLRFSETTNHGEVT